MQLNAEKCKDMVIDFKRHKHHFIPLMVDGKELETVDKAKILGVTISGNLMWNNHLNESIKKANKHLYFLVLLRRARVPAEDIVNFYCTTKRPVLEIQRADIIMRYPRILVTISKGSKRALYLLSPRKFGPS